MATHQELRDRREAICAAARDGKSAKQIAEEFGVALPTVYLAVRANGEKMTASRRGPKPKGPTDRELKMVSMFRQGVTLQKIGEQFGLTRERVRQLLKKQGVVGADGGQQSTVRRRRLDKVARADAKALLKWGVSHAVFLQLRADGVIRGYKDHVRNASQRGIPFHMTFPQWLAIWQASGKLDQRGRGKGKYVMSRINDSGPYEVGNVHVQLATENSREAVKKWLGAPPKVNRGVFMLYPGTDKPWFAKVGKQSLGRHATEEDAVAARNAYLAVTPAKPTKGYATIRDRKRGSAYYQVVIRGKYVGTFKTPELALAARAEFLAAQEA